MGSVGYDIFAHPYELLSQEKKTELKVTKIWAILVNKFDKGQIV
jgi:hypothetical protein